MSRRDRLSDFAAQMGFSVTAGENEVVAENVPCLLEGGIASSCTITQSVDPATGKPDGRIGTAPHAVRITTAQECDGRVYHADGSPIGTHLTGDGRTWSEISVRGGTQSQPVDDRSPHDTVHRYAKRIVGEWAAAGHTGTASVTRTNPFKIPNTFEERAAIAPIQDRIRDQRIAIIGLGGTGAYVLDLLAKTPVPQIHLLDSDHFDWHTFMRAPGAPTEEEIESQKKKAWDKVAYYAAKYDAFREGIRAHPVRVESSAWLAEFLSANPVDCAFVCIDQLRDSDSPRQDVVYEALTDARIPFIDSGVSITIEGDSIRGAVTTSAYHAGSIEWQNAIPNARILNDEPGYRNVQLPEVNALAAALAVMEWRRRTEQYVSESTSFLHKFRMEKPHIVPLRIDAED